MDVLPEPGGLDPDLAVRAARVRLEAALLAHVGAVELGELLVLDELGDEGHVVEERQVVLGRYGRLALLLGQVLGAVGVDLRLEPEAQSVAGELAFWINATCLLFVLQISAC